MAEWNYCNTLISEDGCLITECESHEIAAQIVREHNSHEALVEALQEWMRWARTGTTDTVALLVTESKAALALVEVTT